jgi:D-sedoheptulose 7-phosphate isomerase
MTSPISSALKASAEHLTRASEGPYPAAVDAAIDLLADALRRSNKLLVFGNGGSAADAEHICAELVGRFAMRRAPMAAVALTSNSALLTAWSNDEAFEGVFVRQIEALGRPGDVAWALSTSGTSPNVVAAMRRARVLGLRTIAMTGDGGGALAGLCDVLMAVPALETPRVQEVHLATYHAICAELERRSSAGSL